jgi:hypothetical protein
MSMRHRSHRSRRPGVLERDLARLADGTIEPARVYDVERSVAASTELQARLDEQLQAVAAVRTLAYQRAPATLRMRRRLLVRAARPRRSRFTVARRPALGLGLAGVLAALVLVLTALGGSQAGLTVADAATLAVRPATGMVAEPPDDGTTLPHVRAAGLPFPYWEDRFGWVATGVRRDDVDGRLLTTVFYRRRGSRVAYTIVPGASLLAGHDVRTIRRGGLRIGTFTTGHRLLVMWLRRGHTCVLSGVDVPLDALVKLAAWRNHGTLPY